MSTFSEFNATTHPIVLLADWNYMISQGMDRPVNMMARANGAYYEGLSGTSGKLVYGGSGGDGAVDGTDVDAVQQACIDAVTNGLVYLKDLALGTVTLADGVWVLSETDGYYSYYATNPNDELACQTNPNNAVMFNILAEPTNDPPALDAWNAFTSEIVGVAGLSSYLVAGFFGAKAVGGEDVWAINPISILSPTSTGDTIVCEVDLANQQADGKGIGVASYLGEADGALAANHKDGLYAFHAKDNCSTAGISWQYDYLGEDAIYYSAYMSGDPQYALYGGDVDSGGDADMIMVKAFTNEAFTVTVDPIIKVRKYTPEGAAATGAILQGFLSNEVEPRTQINHGGIYFGAGGASAVDCGIARYGAGQLYLDDYYITGIMSADSDNVWTAMVTGDTQFRSIIRADGAVYWGPGNAAQDVVLYRSAANQLKTDDQLECADGIVTKVVADAVDDGDFTVDTNGLVAIDSSNGRIYVRYGGGWHYAACDAGFQIIQEEKVCPLCHEEIRKGQFTAGWVNGEMSDGALHGLHVHLKCAMNHDAQ